ncbi:hypothetical protein WJX84_001878 [Apatococcus fuscideae]|uniref:Uncharacterized protein n=1 Tax=Apatococcus fuscideae TaxID=2026836 RepID=A0AAW1TGP4_9CHLO
MGFFNSKRPQEGAVSLRKSNEQPLAGSHHLEREPAHPRGSRRSVGLKVVTSLLAILLFLAAGLSIAALVATSWHRFWFYYNGSGIRLRTGYFQWEESTDTVRHSLKEFSKGVYVMGIISLCFTGVSALTAMICFIPVVAKRTNRKLLFIWAQLISLALAGVLIAFYIITAIYEAQYLIPRTRALSICHPDWAWCLAMGSAIAWWLTSLLALGLPVRRRQPESLPIVANGVFGARDMDTIAPLSSPKVAGHDNVAWAQAEPTPELPHKKLRRGRLFGRKSSGAEAAMPTGAMSSALPAGAAAAPSAPVAEPAPIGARYSQWIQNSQPNRIPTRN